MLHQCIEQLLTSQYVYTGLIQVYQRWSRKQQGLQEVGTIYIYGTGKKLASLQAGMDFYLRPITIVASFSKSNTVELLLELHATI